MRQRSMTLANVGLVLLLLVDVLLLGAVLRFPGGLNASGAAATDPTSRPPVAATSAPVPASPTPETSTMPVQSAVVPLRTSVTAVDADVAWRFTVGSCVTGGAAVAVTVDGGRTWRDRPAPYPQISRVEPKDANSAFVVGADERCEMGVRTTTSAGVTWSAPGPVSDTWARDAKDPARVRAPAGRTGAPCGTVTVVDLARTAATSAQVLCADGSIHETSDGGRSWPSAGQVAGGLALDNRQDQSGTTAYVVAIGSGCSGLSVSTVIRGETKQLGCVDVPASPPAGAVALSVVADQGWLVVDKDTWRSRDALRTWTRA